MFTMLKKSVIQIWFHLVIQLCRNTKNASSLYGCTHEIIASKHNH